MKATIAVPAIIVLGIGLTGCFESGGGSSSSPSVTPIDSGNQTPPANPHDLTIDFLHLDTNLMSLYAVNSLQGVHSTSPYLSADGTGLRIINDDESAIIFESSFELDLWNPFVLELTYKMNQSSLTHKSEIALKFVGEGGTYTVRQKMKPQPNTLAYDSTIGTFSTPNAFSFNNTADLPVTLRVERDANEMTTITWDFGSGVYFRYQDANVPQAGWATIQLSASDESVVGDGLDTTLFGLIFDGGVR